MFHVKHSITRHTVPRETFVSTDELIGKFRPSLEQFLEQLLWWNKRVNLVSRDVPRETLWEHIRHSLLVTGLSRYIESQRVIDAGTGGGLPGIPLAVVAPEKNFVLNDIVTKKVMAVRQMVQKLGLKNVETIDNSIEDLETGEPFLLVSKHAFKIHDLFSMTREQPWSEMIFYKGLDFEEELKSINTPLSVEVYDLFPNSGHEFYRDKALVAVKRAG